MVCIPMEKDIVKFIRYNETCLGSEHADRMAALEMF